MSKFYLGIDLGGTNIVAGVVDENYNIIAKSKTKTACPRPAEEIVADMAKVSLEALKECGKTIEDIDHVGVGSPGAVDAKNGVVIYNNNLGFNNTEIAKLLGEALGKKVYVENDANAAAYGEFVAGAAKGTENCIMITLGTGVGGGIIIDKKVYSGFNSFGAEIGHNVIDPNGAMCSCGRKGCFEVFSSATGLIRMTKEAIEANPDSLLAKTAEKEGKVSGRLAFNVMREGDEVAKAVVDKYIKYLGIGVTNLINTFQPEIFCIGGGVSNEGDPLLLPLIEYVEKEVYSRKTDDNTKIVIAKLGNDAGIIGAAFLGADN